MKVIAISALLAMIADQASKYAVIHVLDLARVYAIDVFPPFLNFRYGENRGINFGLLDTPGEASRWILIALAIAVVAVLFWWARQGRKPYMVQLSAGLLIGGALGNVIDRLWYGYVLDFLNMSCCGIANPFVFNLADVFIFLGVAGLLLFDRPAKTKKNAA